MTTADVVVFAQAAFAHELTDDELWLLGAFVKVVGNRGKDIMIGAMNHSPVIDREIPRV
jgi:hypothetical protein